MKNNKGITIYFDMDGTLVDFYTVPCWLENVENENTLPYEIAEPLFFYSFQDKLRGLQRKGYKLGIISKGSKESSLPFLVQTEKAKRRWLRNHLPEIVWDYINVIPYEEIKGKYKKSADDILFDDEEENRAEWDGESYSGEEIAEKIKELLDNI